MWIYYQIDFELFLYYNYYLKLGSVLQQVTEVAGKTFIMVLEDSPYLTSENQLVYICFYIFMYSARISAF